MPTVARAWNQYARPSKIDGVSDSRGRRAAKMKGITRFVVASAAVALRGMAFAEMLVRTYLSRFKIYWISFLWEEK